MKIKPTPAVRIVLKQQTAAMTLKHRSNSVLIRQNKPSGLTATVSDTAVMSSKLREMEERYRVPVNSFGMSGFESLPVDGEWDGILQEMEHSMQVFAEVLEKRQGILLKVKYEDFFCRKVAYLPVLPHINTLNGTGQATFDAPIWDNAWTKWAACSGLSDVKYLPSNITRLAVYYCSMYHNHALREVDVDYVYENNPTYVTASTFVFAYCTSLRKVTFREWYSRTASQLFCSCYRLKEVAGLLHIYGKGSCSGLFAYCYELDILPDFDFEEAGDVITLYNMYYACKVLRVAKLPRAITKTDSWYGFAYGAYFLEKVEGIIDASGCTAKFSTQPFGRCKHLEEVWVKNLGWSMSLMDSPVKRECIEYLITNLQTVETVQTLTLSTHSAQFLTDGLRNAALAKNWTITY